MCNVEEGTEIVFDGNKVSVSFEPWALWDALGSDEKYQVIYDQAYWDMVKGQVFYHLGQSVSGPHFNNETHELRQEILTDEKLQGDMLASFVKEIVRAAERDHETVRSERRRAQALVYQLRNHGIEPAWVRSDEPANTERFDPTEWLEQNLKRSAAE